MPYRALDREGEDDKIEYTGEYIFYLYAAFEQINKKIINATPPN